MADDDHAARRLDRFLTDLGNAPVPPDLAASAASRALVLVQRADTSRQPFLVLAVAFALLAGLAFTVLTGQTPEPTVTPSSAVVDPSRPSQSAPVPSSTEPSSTSAPSPSATDAGSARCGQVVNTTAATGGSKRPLAIVSDAAGLALYDIESDTLDVLDSRHSGQVPPKFRTPGLATFAAARGDGLRGDALYAVDLGIERVTELFRFAHALQGFDWNSDGTLLAYMVASGTETRIGPHALCLFDSRSGETTQLISIRRPFGTAVGQWEETVVTWSPDGTKILAVETSARPSVFVVDLDGRNVIEPREGTFGRWLSDDRVLFQAPHPRNGEEPGEWLTVSTTAGTVRSFDMPGGYRPALSPDGGLIAYDDGATTPSIHLFDVARGTSTKLATGYVAPVWLASDRIAASAAAICPPDFFCVKPWLPTGGTVGIELATGKERALTLTGTLGEIPWFGVIDVWLPSAGS